jgi:site-specific DNA-methyltransferase (adenine-specific)
VHLVVTSPPYNCRVAYDSYDDWLPWDEYWHDLIEPSLRECFRVLAPGGRLAVNLANVVRQDVTSGRRQLQQRPGWRWKPAGANGQPWSAMVAPRLWATLEQIGFMPREQLTWIKALNPEDIVTSTAWGSWRSASNPVLRAVAEPVFIASKVTHTRSPGISDLTCSEFKAWTRNVWNIPVGNAERDLDHPCKFPPELPRRLIKLYSYVGDVVLDPFCGSGTTLRVAKDLARRAIGVDVSRRYCAMSADRCRQQLLFAAALEAPDGLDRREF